MKYREYLDTAQRHLATCKKFVKTINESEIADKKNLLKDIYYLSGYIFEAITVFIIYKTGYSHVRDLYKMQGKVFEPDKHDVDEFIKEFTQFTKVDYYPVYNGVTKRIYLGSRMRDRKTGKKLKISDDDKKFLNEFVGLNAIEQHHFVDLIENIKNNKELFNIIFPPSEDVPFFVTPVTIEVETLIRGWSSGLRYSDALLWKKIEKDLNESSLKDLLDVCQEIVFYSYQKN